VSQLPSVLEEQVIQPDEHDSQAFLAVRYSLALHAGVSAHNYSPSVT